ncbi:MAG: hypothetical protein KL787_06255 [Taibaiella sp.]|nr:hypothetical protein [Taibaiella sp.]
MNLARSIHDEANPALLYAKTLLKARNESSGEKSELEKHIEHTMQLIRSLSHDLKSENQYTLSDLIQAVSESLNKLNVDGSFQEKVLAYIDKSRFLSHYQFTQLKAIMNECITNTIKHACFDEIAIRFEQKDNKLQIQYSDNAIIRILNLQFVILLFESNCYFIKTGMLNGIGNTLVHDGLKLCKLVMAQESAFIDISQDLFLK